MCRPVTCKKCNKTTWAGCGQHVDEVMADVPAANQCTCDATASVGPKKGFFSRLFGR